MTRRRWIGVAALAVVGSGWLIVGAVFNGYRIPVESMEPTLHKGDRVLARSIDGDDASPGDVVIFTAPGPDAGIERISRVIAVEGDDVATEGGILVVNGEPINEPIPPRWDRDHRP